MLLLKKRAESSCEGKEGEDDDDDDVTATTTEESERIGRVTVVWTLFQCSPIQIAGVSSPYRGVIPLTETDRTDIP